jgi:hypothetical protein
MKNCYQDPADDDFFPEALGGFGQDYFCAGSPINISQDEKHPE